jgi:hypothetical protein
MTDETKKAHQNTGHRNTGHRNTGHLNTGDQNTGDLNTGDWNTGDQNTGFFCTETPLASFFDKPTALTFEQARELIPFVEPHVCVAWTVAAEMTEEEKSNYPAYKTTGGFLRAQPMPTDEWFPLAWRKLDQVVKDRFKALPNFDAEKFLAITGVDLREPVKPLLKIQLADGSTIEIEGRVLA